MAKITKNYNMSRTKRIIVNILVLAICIALYFLGTRYLYPYIQSLRYVAPDLRPSSYINLWTSENYKKAEDLLAMGSSTEALEAYKKILQETAASTTVDNIVNSQIVIRIATLYDKTGQKDIAIDKLFEIVNSPDSYFITKAFAYEYLSRMLYMTKEDEVYDLISKKISAEDKIAVESKNGSRITNLSLFLLDKSIATAPLYLALSQKAYIESSNSTTQELATKRPEYIRDLRRYEAMIGEIERDNNIGYMLPLALARKAQIIEVIYIPGLTKELPEEYYKSAVKSYDKYSEARSYNYVYYEYARYLAVTYGDSKKTEILTLLDHFSKDVAEKENLKAYLTGISKDKNSKEYKQMILLKKVSGKTSIAGE